MADVAAIKERVLDLLEKNGGIPDSEELAKENGWSHDKLVGVLKSLEAESQVTNEGMKREGHKLTAEGEACIKDGSPECRVFAQVLKEAGKATNASVDQAVGAAAKVGVSTAMKNKWISIDKATKCLTAALDKAPKDETQAELGSLSSLSKDKLDALKKRKLIATTSLTALKTKTTESFSRAAKKAVADITADMLLKGTWSQTEFKTLNFDNVNGAAPNGGHLHPLSKVKAEVKKVLMCMGFEEMKTNRWVESSFWNFDSLFQPQQHPARDAHDTFFMESPARAQDIPADYLERVKKTHEEGGYGSIGWRYDWSEDEARKNILRTHTTAVSSRTLVQMAEDYKRTGVFTPRKYFSIDRVFRNETLDATHLAEFHQVEGFVADRGLGLGHLIGVLSEFFKRVGISKLRFKPAYNPYTEPSMEIFGYHSQHKKWIEVGNSGVFRPEMLRPMGLPDDVSVVAWGIGLERWTMLHYNIKAIKDLFSFQQDVASSKKNAVCWLKRVEDEEEKKEEKK